MERIVLIVMSVCECDRKKRLKKTSEKFGVRKIALYLHSQLGNMKWFPQTISIFNCTTREYSSAGSEHLPYKQRVRGSNPCAPTQQSEVESHPISGGSLFILHR